MYCSRIVTLFLLCAFALFHCDEDAPNGDVDADGDTDGAPDGDGDTDADVETDADGATADADPDADQPCPEPQLLAGAAGDNVSDAAGRGQIFERIRVEGLTDPEGSHPDTQGAAVADFDGDGHVDILAVSKSSGARLLLGEGCFRFRDHPLTITSTTDDAYVPTVADFNNDGFLDVYISNSMSPGNRQAARFFLSQGAFDVLDDVAEQMGVANRGTYNHGRVAVADIDGDGHLDMGVGANQIGNGQSGRPLRRIYRYVPGAGGYQTGHFEDIGQGPLVPGFSQTVEDQCDPDVDRSGPMMLFRDFDDDGDLDIITGHSNDMLTAPRLTECSTGSWHFGVSAWRNLLADSGTFAYQQLTERPGSIVEVGRMRYDDQAGHYVPVSAEMRAFGPLNINAADVDNDGDLDVLGVTPTDVSWHVHSDQIVGRLWINEGTSFRVATDEAGLAPLSWTYDEWGAFWGAQIPEQSDAHDYVCSIGFQQPLCEATTPGDAQFMAGGGTVFADFDNDGWLDFILFDRHEVPEMYGVLRNVIFHNRGDGTFEPLTTEISGIDTNSMSAAARDFDGDGLIDLYFIHSAVNSGGVDAFRDLDTMFWNTGAGGGADNHWVELYPTGRSQAALVSTRLFLLDAASGDVIGRRDLFHTAGSYKSSQDLHAHFGLGSRTEVSLRAVLPDGDSLVFESIPIDSRVLLDVAAGTATPL